MTNLKTAACWLCVGAIVALVALSRDGASVRAASGYLARKAGTVVAP